MGQKPNLESLSEHYKSKFPTDKEFIKYLEAQGIYSENRQEIFLTALRYEFTKIHTPDELANYEDHHGKKMTKKYREAVIKFFNYFIYNGDKELNGYNIELWIKSAKDVELIERTSASEIEDNEIEEVGGELSNEDVRVFYYLIAYSGAPSSQLFDLLDKETTDKKDRIIERISKDTYPGMERDIIRVDASKYGRGTVRPEYFYFPIELEKTLQNYSTGFTVFHYKKSINKKLDNNRKMNVSSMRSWNYDFMFRTIWMKDHLSNKAFKNMTKTMKELQAYLNIVHGNIAVSQVSVPFTPEVKAERAKLGAVLYSRIVNDLVKIIGIPDIMRNGKFTDCDRNTKKERDEKRLRVKEMLEAIDKNGKYLYSNKEIIEKLGTSSNLIQSVQAEYGMRRI